MRHVLRREPVLQSSAASLIWASGISEICCDKKTCWYKLLQIENNPSLSNHCDITSPPESIQAGGPGHLRSLWHTKFRNVLHVQSLSFVLSVSFQPCYLLLHLWHYILCYFIIYLFANSHSCSLSHPSVCSLHWPPQVSPPVLECAGLIEKAAPVRSRKESEGTSKLKQRGQQWTKHNHIVTDIVKLEQPSCSSSVLVSKIPVDPQHKSGCFTCLHHLECVQRSKVTLWSLHIFAMKFI